MVLQEILARCFLSAKDDGCVLKLGIILCENILFEVMGHLKPRSFKIHSL